MPTYDTCPQNESQPLLRWAGSKRKLLPTILGLCPQNYRTYVEPFAGSACLFFALQPHRAIVADFNKDLVETYESIALDPDRVADLVHSFPITEEFYYRQRALRPSALHADERAARFVYLNRFCFNGVYRTNRRGEFNVPRGSKTGSLPTREHFRCAAYALRRSLLLCDDFEAAIGLVQKCDFVYLDPPYTKDGSRYSGEYGYGAFSSYDLGRLSASLKTIDKRGATFLLSYRCNGDSLRLFGEWNIRRLKVRRHVAGFSEHRGNVFEILCSNSPLTSRPI